MRTKTWMGLLLAALGVVGLAVSGWLPLEPLRAPLGDRLSETLGRAVRIDGSLDVEFFPAPHLRARGVEIASPVEICARPLLRIGSLRVDFRLRRLVFGVLDIERLRLQDVEVHLERAADGSANWQDLTLSDSAGPTRLQTHLRAIRVEDARIEHVDAAGGFDWSGVLDEVELARRPGDLRELSAEGHIPLGPFALAARLEPTGGSPTSYRLSADADLGGFAVDASGTIDQPARLQGIDLVVKAHADRAPASPYLPKLLHGLGPIGLRARLHDDAGVLGLEELLVRVGRETASWAQAQGSIRDLRGLEGVAIELRFSSPDLHGLSSELGRNLPNIGALAGSARIDDARGGLDVERFDLRATRGETFDLAMLGGMQDALGGAEVDVNVQLEAHDLATLGDLIGRSLPPIGPVTARGRIRGAARSIGLEDLSVIAGDDELRIGFRGAIADLVDLRGVELEAELEARALEALAPYVEVPLIDVGTVRASGSLRDEDGSLGVEHFQVETRQPALEMSASGGIDDVTEIDEIDVQLDLSARALADVGRPFGLSLPARGPVVFSGRVTGSDEKAIARGVRLEIGESRFEGLFEASFPSGQRPRLLVSLDAPHLVLADVGIDPGTRKPVPPSQAPRLTFLRRLDGQLLLRAERVVGRAGLDIDRMSTDIRLEDGMIEVRDVELDYKEGEVTGTLRVDTREPAHAIALSGDADGVDLEKLFAQLTDEFVLSGALHLEADVSSRGQTLPALLASLDGRVTIVVEEGRVASDYSRAFVRDLMRALTSSEEEADSERMHCLIAAFEVEDGVASSEVLVIDTDPVTIVGSGAIDLGARSIDMRFTPTPRNPGTFSIATPVAVRGPLADPEVVPEKGSVVLSALRNFFGGTARRLRGLLPGRAERVVPERWRSRLTGEGPCASALRRSGAV